MEHQQPFEPLAQGKTEYSHVSKQGGEVQISKFDKEGRQDYTLIIPEKEYKDYTNEGIPIEKALPNFSEQQREFLRTNLTPAEQRIVRNPAYQQAVESLMAAAPAEVKAERAAILANYSRRIALQCATF